MDFSFSNIEKQPPEVFYEKRCSSRGVPPEVFCKKGVLRNFAKFIGKVAGLKPASSL